MTEHKFFIVDAFTEKTFGGNAAGVVILAENEDFPSNEKMIKLAAELRYSETVFIKPEPSDNECDFYARYFTPTNEVDLCGHATIGGMYCLNKTADLKNGSIRLKTKAGIINVEVNGNDVLMDMASPLHIATFEEGQMLGRIYETMGIAVPDDGSISNLKPMAISTGLPDIMLPIPSKEVLDSMKPKMNLISELSNDLNVVGIHAFTTNYNGELSAERSVFCRNFAPLYGIDEEAATGTSNGALAYYFYINNMLTANSVLNVIQGESMDRPSSITAKLSKVPTDSDGGDLNVKSDVKIRVGGSAAVLASGIVNL